MPSIGIGELVVIFLLLLIFVGPDRLPQVARTMGKLMGEVRRATDELKNSLYLEDVRQRRMPRDSGTRPQAADAQPRPRSTAVRHVELPDEGPPQPVDTEGGADPADDSARSGWSDTSAPAHADAQATDESPEAKE